MSIAGRLRSAFLAGIVVLAPALVTGYVVWFLAGVLAGLLRPLTRALGLTVPLTRIATALGLTTGSGEVAVVADAVAALLVVSVVTLVGLVAQNAVGRQVMGGVGRLVNVVPLADTVYGTIRSVADALVEGESRYEKVVVVEYPREGVYALGLVTGRSTAFDAIEPNLSTVFFPNSPNPTGGRLALVPDDAIYEADVSVGRGLRLLVTTGIGTEALPDAARLEPAENRESIEASPDGGTGAPTGPPNGE